MRGYGQSYAPADPSLYSALHTVSDLVGILDALDIPTAVLVGHDWGADVAQRAMVIQPDRYRAAQDTFDLMSAYKNQTIKQPSLYLWGAEDGLCQFFHPTSPSPNPCAATHLA